MGIRYAGRDVQTSQDRSGRNGRDSDCTWTPIEMPFLTVTLLDFDCGVGRPQCEEVTSTDHSSYEGGKTVTVTQYDDYVSFGKKKGLISNAENNVVLTEEQKSMYNCAKWLRTILMAGISNKLWEGVVTPSPTPHPTESSPTPSPTPSPTCAFSTVSGQGTVECDCISSPNYPGDYSASDHCVICVEQGTALHVLEFLTEQDYDLLWVSGQSCGYSEGPDGVEAEGQIEWTSDTQGTEKEWSICTRRRQVLQVPSLWSGCVTPMIGAFQAQISQETMERRSSAASPSMWTPPSIWLSSRPNFLTTFWRTGWSTFVKIPHHSQAGSTKLLIDGHVRPYTAVPCVPAFLQEVRMNGTWLPRQCVLGLLRAASRLKSARMVIRTAQCLSMRMV